MDAILDFPSVETDAFLVDPPRPRRVLVVDDDESQVLALATRLGKQGYETLSAFSARECLALARSQRPDLIVLDVGLPDGDGLRVCTELADLPDTCDIPVIILSGMCRPDIVRCSRAAGCKYFVRKPYDPNALLTLIEHSIRSAGDADW